METKVSRMHRHLVGAFEWSAPAAPSEKVSLDCVVAVDGFSVLGASFDPATEAPVFDLLSDGSVASSADGSDFGLKGLRVTSMSLVPNYGVLVCYHNGSVSVLCRGEAGSSALRPLGNGSVAVTAGRLITASAVNLDGSRAAVGCHDGSVVMFSIHEMLTREDDQDIITVNLEGATLPITAVSFLGYRDLVAASRDGSCRVWNVASCSVQCSLCTTSPILSLLAPPSSPSIFFLGTARGEILLVDILWRARPGTQEKSPVAGAAPPSSTHGSGASSGTQLGSKSLHSMSSSVVSLTWTADGDGIVATVVDGSRCAIEFAESFVVSTLSPLPAKVKLLPVPPKVSCQGSGSVSRIDPAPVANVDYVLDVPDHMYDKLVARHQELVEIQELEDMILQLHQQRESKQVAGRKRPRS